MPKIRHRKRIRSARHDPTARPTESATAGAASPAPTNTVENGAAEKRVGKQEAEVVHNLEKLLKGTLSEQFAASAELAKFMSWNAVTLRLYLSKNLIGTLVTRLAASPAATSSADEKSVEDDVLTDCLGCLRNLAATQPLSLLSEMFNKKLLPSLLSQTHLLLPLLPTYLSTPTSPSHESYYTRIDHLLTLFWCLVESTPKIVKEVYKAEILEKIALLAEKFLDKDGMGLTGKGGKGKKASGLVGKGVPSYVSLSAGHLLHSLYINAANPSWIKLSPDSITSLSVILTSPAPSSSSSPAEWSNLQILSFGVLLLISTSSSSASSTAPKWKGKGKKEDSIAEIKKLLEENVEVLTKYLNGVDLAKIVGEGLEAAKAKNDDEIQNLETSLSTLLLALEVLSTYCSTLDITLTSLLYADEEEWGGIPDSSMDAEMSSEDDDVEMGTTTAANDSPILPPKASTTKLCLLLPKVLLNFLKLTELSFLPPTAFSSSTTPASSTLIPTTSTSTSNGTSINSTLYSEKLREFSETISLINIRAGECLNQVFVKLASAFSLERVGRSEDKDDEEEDGEDGDEMVDVIEEDLMGSDDGSDEDEEKMDDDSDEVVAPTSKEVSKSELDLQVVLEKVLEVIKTLAMGSNGYPASTVEGEDDEVENRKLELILEGLGTIWGVVRVGAKDESLVIQSDLCELSIALFSNLKPDQLVKKEGEILRVRIAGILGWIGRRSQVSIAENQRIGSFLLTVLPLDSKTPSIFTPTTEVLLQTIDSIIDLYADEESSYDVAVFRQGEFLKRLESSVGGVRAATKKVDRKKFPELRARADGGLDNLEAFIKYRKSVV